MTTKSLEQRDRLLQVLSATAFVVLAIAVAVFMPWQRELSWLTLALFAGCYTLARRVVFPVGTIWADSTQIIFVPMLFLLPAPIIPAVVGVCCLLSRLRIDGRRLRAVPSPPLLGTLGDCLYVFPPVLVFASFGVTDPSFGDTGVYLLAALGQVLFTVGFYAVLTAWIARRRLSIRDELGWAILIDVLFAGIGMLVAIAATQTSPLAVLLITPLFAIFVIFARERTGRIEATSELTSAYRGTAMLLGDVVEADHHYTGTHSREVVDLSVRVADHLDLDDDQRLLVEFGALLHDVGKISVPKSIIDKAGPLDDAEWEIMKQHTVEGQRLLDRVGGALSRVGKVVRASHEHYDGRGYPDGLTGETIPLEARIVSCCDAYSAMTTDRAYRSAMSREEAMVELRREAGHQFDPVVVGALIDVLASLPPDGDQSGTDVPRISVGLR